MNGKPALTNLFPSVVVARSRITPTIILAILLLEISARHLQAQGRPRGEAIGGVPITSKLPAPTSVIQTNTNFTALVSTNVVGECAIGFEMLSSFPMQLPENLINNTNQAAWADAQVNAKIPASIKALDGKKVRIDGFMMPTLWDKTGKVCDFLLLGNQISCCYGGPTQVHEFITIHVKGKSVESNMESPIPVRGILHVGAVRENGQLVGIYRLETDNLVVSTGY